jgi:predicted flap endonuclease-1-like 5' DNA nuclease
MGFLTDIAEIVALLFVAYMAGWLVGYLAHRLAVRQPHLETVPAASKPATTPEPSVDALVKAPVVVPVATTPPPQVSAAVTAIEPVKATAVPDEGDPQPESPPAAVPVSALDTLKSLATAMPLLPPDEPAQAAEVAPAVLEEMGAAGVSTSAPRTETPGPAATSDEAEATPVEPAAVMAPALHAASAPVAEAEAKPVSLPPPVVLKATPNPAPVKRTIRLAPATRAGETAATPPPATPASAPGMPWAGAIKGHEAQKFSPEALADPTPTLEEVDEPVGESDAALDVALLSSIADGLKLGSGATLADDGDMPVAAVEPPASPPPAQSIVAVESLSVQLPEPEPVAPAEPATSALAGSAPPPPVEPAPAETMQPVPVSPSRPPLDEDAAMRAIEGGWSRRDVRALGDAPEFTDVSAAVSAAQVAVEQVLARNGVDAAEPDARAQASFGKPPGLPQPRDGRRDSLKRIDGLGPIDEVTLNNLGIYHFDQIARWTEREVLWLENHAFAVGRIGREEWQDQARDLLAERDATRALR